jgi:hypothetical protein
MTNPTSNFGWQMPTNTDLVYQLPADFEVFGQAVDTSLADLRGGTTNQLLAKNSATDMDFKWVAPAGGLTFISSTAIGNGVSSVSLNNVFSATYRNYRVMINWTEATAGSPNVNLRLRVGGTDNTGAFAYQPRGWSNVSGSLAGFGSAGSSLFVAKLSGANPITTMDITLPFVALQTNFVVNAFEGNNNDAWGFQATHTAATSYDGFTVFPASSTFTGGTIDVYGYGV